MPAAWASQSQWSREGRRTLGRVSSQSSQSCRDERGAGPDDAPDPWGDVRTGAVSVGPVRGAGAASALAGLAAAAIPVPVPVAHGEEVVSQKPAWVSDGCTGIVNGCHRGVAPGRC